jgi:adenosylhomocysteinase
VDQPAGVPVFAFKGETLEEYWQLADRIFDWSAEGFDGPNLILDDGGDATLLVHKGVEFEAAGGARGIRERLARVPHRARHAALSLARDPQRFTRCAQIIGVTEETTTGVHRLYELAAAGTAVPGDQRQRLGHQEQVRQQVRHPPLASGRHQPCHRRAHRRQGRLRRRLRRRRQGAAEALRGQGARDHRRGRPDLRAAGGDGRLPGRALESVVGDVDILITGTGNTRVVTVDHLQNLKHLAIVGNVGHFDDEIDIAGLEAIPGVEKIEIKPQVHEYRLPGADVRRAASWS